MKLFKTIIIFTIGFAAGAVAANLVLTKKYEELVQEEISSIKMAKARTADTKPKANPEESVTDQVNNLVREKKEYVHVARKYGEPATDDNRPVNGVEPPPYVINSQQFSDDEIEFEKSTIYYYASDDVLVDEDEDIIDSRYSVIGDDIASYFMPDADGCDVVYIRNERLETDYEVICVSRRYLPTDSGEE